MRIRGVGRACALNVAVMAGMLGGSGGLGAPAAKASNITYRIVDNPAVQNGYTLSGSITTNGQIGTLASQDILSWNWTVTNGINTYTADSSQVGSFIGLDGTILATSDYIELPAQPVTSPSTLNLFGPNSHVQWSGSTIQNNAFTSAFQVNGSWPWWHDQTTTTPHDVPGGWAIADQGVTQAVPEPSSLALASSLAICLAWRHRRRKVAV